LSLSLYGGIGYDRLFLFGGFMAEANAAAAKKKPKAKLTSARKRHIQSEKNRLRNRGHRSQVRTALRTLDEAIEKKEEAQAIQAKLSALYSLMDKGVKKGVYKPNKAARTKSRLSARVAK
jgi:small subunit ribosomal protein S20